MKTIKVELSADDVRLITAALGSHDQLRLTPAGPSTEAERGRLHALWGKLKDEARKAEMDLR